MYKAGTMQLSSGELFRQHRSEIEGILVCLPNFGDEKAISDAIRLSELRCAHPRASISR